MKQRIANFWLAAVFFGSILASPAGPTVTNVFAGTLQSFLVLSDGSLWATGNNSYGQLGDGTFNYPIYRFKEIHTNGAGVVATAGNHTLLVNSDGSLEAVGDDTAGDLGDGGSNPVNKLIGVNVVPTGVISIGAGIDHSMFVTKGGALMGMGANNQAQLGDGTENNTNKPEQIVAHNVLQVACSSSASFYLRNDGSVWGSGLFNKIRYDHNVYQFQPVLARGAAAIACGANHGFIITTNGALLAFGANNAGQLGDGTTNDHSAVEQIVSNGVIAIACGASHSHFIESDGSLWAMGFNANGELAGC